MTLISSIQNPGTRYRIIFGDTDAGGIVYHPRYLELAERGRNEAMRQLGLDVGRLFAEDGYGLALRSAEMKFHAPAMFDDLLTVTTTLARLKAASAVWVSRIQRGAVDICTVKAEIICMERVRHAPVLFPKMVQIAFRKSAELGPQTVIQPNPSTGVSE